MSQHTLNQVHASFHPLWNTVRRNCLRASASRRGGQRSETLPSPHSQRIFDVSWDHGQVCLSSIHARSFTHPHPSARHRRVSPRGSSNPVNHALTYFNHVQLPPTALLTTPHRARDPRAEFFHNISRVIVGTLSMAASCLPGMRTASYIAGKYSLRRVVTDASTGIPRPIISFSTQYIPVMTGIANTFVLIAFMGSIHAAFTDPELEPTTRHFLAAVAKVTVFGHTIKDIMALGDRCGAQGLLQANQIDAFIVCTRSLCLFI